jgi:D-alanyl-lipoteichoic acid acyltransferase DltB (MBOAT superfamily)
MRADSLIPQLREKHVFTPAGVTVGLRLVLWGLFIKTMVADNLAVYVNAVYNNITAFAGLTIILATVGFAFQIYCDFAGYSYIAVGSAKVMGIDLINNFNYPYISQSLREFWRRWHISLSTWFRDYVYIPLGGNRRGDFRRYLNLFITFTLSGLWHGAAWTFVIWGMLHGLFVIIENIAVKLKTKLRAQEKNRKWNIGWLRIAFTFSFVCFAWIFSVPIV